MGRNARERRVALRSDLFRRRCSERGGEGFSLVHEIATEEAKGEIFEVKALEEKVEMARGRVNGLTPDRLGKRQVVIAAPV